MGSSIVGIGLTGDVAFPVGATGSPSNPFAEEFPFGDSHALSVELQRQAPLPPRHISRWQIWGS